MRDEILRLRTGGKSVSAIAKALRIEQSVVRETLRNTGSLARRLSPHASMDGSNLGDPQRADRLLRRFSWEA